MSNTVKFDRVGTVKCLKTFGSRYTFGGRLHNKNYFNGDVYNVVDIQIDGAVVGGAVVNNCDACKFEYIDK